MLRTFVFVTAATLVKSSGSAVFDYLDSGETWGHHYPLCEEGKEQSPIDLTLPSTSTVIKIDLDKSAYKNYANASITRSSSSVSVGYTDGKMQLTFDSGMTSDFKPANLHFHSPSEHKIDGQSYDLETHFVHTYLDGESLGAVIGVMFDRKLGGNMDNLFLDQMIGIWSSPNITNVSN